MIEAYFTEIEQTIQEFPSVRFVSLKRKTYNTIQGYIGGSIIFDNNHRLDFVEVKNTIYKNKIKYRYHYMDEDQKIIFRYDNAPHHANILTFPHHKHEFDENNVVPNPEVDLSLVLLEIAQYQQQALRSLPRI